MLCKLRWNFSIIYCLSRNNMLYSICIWLWCTSVHSSQWRGRKFSFSVLFKASQVCVMALSPNLLSIGNMTLLKERSGSIAKCNLSICTYNGRLRSIWRLFADALCAFVSVCEVIVQVTYFQLLAVKITQKNIFLLYWICMQSELNMKICKTLYTVPYFSLQTSYFM